MELSVSRGEAYALACGFLWAVNSLILRTQALKLQPRLVNMIRCGAGGLLLCLALPLGGPLASLLQVTPLEWCLLFGSLLFGVVLGDTGYIAALREVGVSRTMADRRHLPVGHPTVRVGVVRPCRRTGFVGGILPRSGRGGIYDQPSHGRRRTYNEGQGRCRAGAWSRAVLGPELRSAEAGQPHMSGIHANAVRMPLVVLILFFSIALPSGLGTMRNLKTKSVLIVAASGAVSMGLVGILFVDALKDGSATKIVTLTSTSPLFALILAVVFLKEKLNARVLVGSGCCLSGVFLVL